MLIEDSSEERGNSRIPFIVPNSLVGCTCEFSEPVNGSTTNDVLVVSMKLCECLLYQWSPKSIIIANFSENS